MCVSFKNESRLSFAECLTHNGNCDPLTVCTNTLGSRQCSNCPLGYSGDGYIGCTAVDWCATNNGGCSVAPLVSCTNSGTSRVCGPCPPGFSGTGDTACVPVNCKCCLFSVSCNVLLLSFDLKTFPPAFVPVSSRFLVACCLSANSPHICFVPFAVCNINNGGCDPHTTCSYNPVTGVRTCGSCPSPGFVGTGSSGCVAIDLCFTNNGGCDPLVSCTPTTGSRLCGNCPTGYTGTGDTHCLQTLYCKASPGPCDPLTVCTDLPGMFVFVFGCMCFCAPEVVFRFVHML